MPPSHRYQERLARLEHDVEDLRLRKSRILQMKFLTRQIAAPFNRGVRRVLAKKGAPDIQKRFEISNAAAERLGAAEDRIVRYPMNEIRLRSDPPRQPFCAPPLSHRAAPPDWHHEVCRPLRSRLGFALACDPNTPREEGPSPKAPPRRAFPHRGDTLQFDFAERCRPENIELCSTLPKCILQSCCKAHDF